MALLIICIIVLLVSKQNYRWCFDSNDALAKQTKHKMISAESIRNRILAHMLNLLKTVKLDLELHNDYWALLSISIEKNLYTK